MSNHKEVMQQALDALEALLSNIRRDAPHLSGKSMGRAEVAGVALRAALAAPQPAQEPVAWPSGSAQLHTSLLDMGKAMAKERSREIGDAWNQLADLLYLLSKARNTPQAPQPAQEPVAVIGSDYQLLWVRRDWSEGLNVGDFLYTTPPAPQPLTNCRNCGGPDDVLCAGQCKRAAHGVTKGPAA